MKYLNNIIFFLAILFATSALIFNIIIVQGDKVVKIDFLQSVDAISFVSPDSQIGVDSNDEITNKISALVRKSNPTVFSGLLKSKNPIEKFYGFYCGFFSQLDFVSWQGCNIPLRKKF